MTTTTMNYYKVTEIEFDFDYEDLTQEEKDVIIQDTMSCLWTSPSEEELTDTITNNTVQYIATFGAGTPNGGATIAEAGIFNSSTANAGTMLCRVRFNEVNKANSDVIVITWNVTIQ